MEGGGREGGEGGKEREKRKRKSEREGGREAEKLGKGGRDRERDRDMGRWAGEFPSLEILFILWKCGRRPTSRPSSCCGFRAVLLQCRGICAPGWPDVRRSRASSRSESGLLWTFDCSPGAAVGIGNSRFTFKYGNQSSQRYTGAASGQRARASVSQFKSTPPESQPALPDTV